MTATYTVDIFCDGPDCLQWTHGHVQRGSGNQRKARQAAAAAGWARRRVAGQLLDLCPACQEASAAPSGHAIRWPDTPGLPAAGDRWECSCGVTGVAGQGISANQHAAGYDPDNPSCRRHPDGYWIHDYPAGAKALDSCYCGRSHLLADPEPGPGEAVWCVESRDGWCAIAGNARPPEGETGVPTRCGMVVVFPGKYDQRQPDCPECIGADVGERS